VGGGADLWVRVGKVRDWAMAAGDEVRETRARRSVKWKSWLGINQTSASLTHTYTRIHTRTHTRIHFMHYIYIPPPRLWLRLDDLHPLVGLNDVLFYFVSDCILLYIYIRVCTRVRGFRIYEPYIPTLTSSSPLHLYNIIYKYLYNNVYIYIYIDPYTHVCLLCIGRYMFTIFHCGRNVLFELLCNRLYTHHRFLSVQFLFLTNPTR